MVYTVYQTRNLVNGRIYIGVHKTDNPNDSYLGSGHFIKSAVRKYGRANFQKEVLFVFQTLEEAYSKEAELVTKDFVAREDTYNLTSGGVVSPDFDPLRKLHYSQRMKGENHPQWGKVQTEESNAKRSAALVGRKLPRARVEKSASSRRGKPSSLKGLSQTEESNALRSIAHLALEKVECPVCSKLVSPQNASRWHFEKCTPRKPRYALK